MKDFTFINYLYIYMNRIEQNRYKMIEILREDEV